MLWRFDASVDVTAADWRHCNVRGGRADRSAQDPNSNSAAEGLAAKRAKAVGAVSQATGQLHGALQGVDAVETMVADVQGGTAVLAGVALDIEHQAAENRILGPGGTPGNLSLLGHTLPLILPGQPLLLAFFPPVVCEPVMLSSALRRMASERAWSVTTRETVSAPIRVKAATIARLLASSGVPSANPPARAPTSFKNPAVAAARVRVSARAISLPSAASGQPSRGLSRCSAER